MKKLIEKIRVYLILTLLTVEEKELINEAITDKIDSTHKILVRERWAFEDDIRKDLESYRKLREIFNQ